MPERSTFPGPATPVSIVGSVDSEGSSSSSVVVEQQTYDLVHTGEVVGSTTQKQLPDIPSSLVKIKARSDNSGSVFIGTSSSVSRPTGSGDDTTSGFELDAGDETGWIPVDNLNRFFIICDNAGDDLTYLVQV